MKNEYRIEELSTWVETVRAGDLIFLSGKIYAARDAVHKKWLKMFEEEKTLPLTFENTGIYYTGVTPAPAGRIIGSCGPTTSTRMDTYYQLLSNYGLRLTIGKGMRSEEVRKIIERTKGIYLCAIGGAGALYSSCIVENKIIQYEELGCEALRELIVEHFPVFVGIDASGNTIFT